MKTTNEPLASSFACRKLAALEGKPSPAREMAFRDGIDLAAEMPDRFAVGLRRNDKSQPCPVLRGGMLIKKENHPQAHLTNRTKLMSPQPMASRPEAIVSKSKKTPPPPENPTKANVPTAAKSTAQPSQAHQGR